MMGWSTLPRSPEKTSFLVTPFSVHHSSISAEPSRWPASLKRTRTPSHRSTISPYSQVSTCWSTASASFRV